MDQREEQLKNLKYGSYKKIKEAFDKGAGVFFRSDVEILIEICERYKDLEQ